ncbi:hypothetical protein SADUNF_Sadunf11G0102700 [Salix dunnii]|uniref:Translation initiation factor IF-2, chloroplastic n=1 Tax=Salix dunnii TaxID=1413687 RepID=A0A835JR13_9ROSI|nr:hypothetical protein SADUNF_Sadunf11G0102700 [Salix dunnii]
MCLISVVKSNDLLIDQFPFIRSLIVLHYVRVNICNSGRQHVITFAVVICYAVLSLLSHLAAFVWLKFTCDMLSYLSQETTVLLNTILQPFGKHFTIVLMAMGPSKNTIAPPWTSWVGLDLGLIQVHQKFNSDERKRRIEILKLGMDRRSKHTNCVFHETAQRSSHAFNKGCQFHSIMAGIFSIQCFTFNSRLNKPLRVFSLKLLVHHHQEFNNIIHYSPATNPLLHCSMPSLASLMILKRVSLSKRSNDVSLDSSGAGSKDETLLMGGSANTVAALPKVVKEPPVSPPPVIKKPGPAPGKYRDRKKSVSPGTPRRRMVDDDVEIPDEELNVSIPGASTGRKGRKWTKASRKAAKLQAARDAAPVKVEILEVEEKGMSIEELAYNLTINEGEILGFLYSKGIKPDGVQTLDKDMVKMICKEHEVEVIDANPVKFEEMAKKKEILDEDDLDKLQERPPVLTIMGHVDHGKASGNILSSSLKVAASEAGGITQGIGAYKVMIPVDGKLQPCVFLDTPGHEAFGAMRARGARVTDIAIIVVAADDGIRPQTKEAIAHAKAAGVPIVITINKIDKDGANPERVMQELSSIGLMPEDWGGDVPMVQISALKGENIDDLLETVMLVAELQELKANPDRNAKGTVIEAGLDKSKGPVATFIVQNGTLKRGDVVVCGQAFGKVRALFDDGGNRVDEAGPSIPVQVIGLSNVPIAGDEFEVVTSLDIAREKAEKRAESLWNEHISAKAGDGKVTLSSLASAGSVGKLSGLDLHQLNIIMKVDLQGSIEAIRQALQVLPRDNVTLKFLLQATGDVSNSDVDLAIASEAIILGFNVKAPGSVKSYAEKRGVEIRLYRVIYELIDDVRNAMEGLLEPVEEQKIIGSAEVRAVFSSGSGRVAGCMVTEGKIVKGCGIRVVRKRKTAHVGVLDSLRRIKEMVKEVNAGLECGIGAEDYDDWEEGDIIEAFNTGVHDRSLSTGSQQVVEFYENGNIF